MTLSEIQLYLTQLPNVTTVDAMGFRFFNYSTDQMRPFVSLIESDNEHDRFSNLTRAGVFRLNIGVSRDSFKALFPDAKADWDYTELDKFMPHPEYAAFHFICVLNPAENTLKRTLQLIDEAHAIAKVRFESK